MYKRGLLHCNHQRSKLIFWTAFIFQLKVIELKKLLRVCEANFGPLFGEMSREREGPTLSD